MTTLCLLGLLLALGWGAGGAVRADTPMIIITHPDVGLDSLAIDELKFIYLGKRARWGDGIRVHPAMLKKSDLHDTFVTELLDRSPAKFKAHWKQLVFTGKGIPPKSFATEDDLVAYVRGTEGGIGYVSGATATDGVRAVVVD
jgi:ABC-type phosphate transport system substrate-binding protein